MRNTFDITSDIDKALKGLTALDEKNISFAVAKAMTLTGQFAQNKLKVALNAAIDRPTPFTMNSTFVTFAKPTKLFMEVGIKSQTTRGRIPAGRYLQSLIKGKAPTVKAVDQAASKIAGYKGVLVPSQNSPVKLNRYGNVSLANYKKVIGGARSSGTYYIAPVKRGSSVKAVFQRKESIIRGTSTIAKDTRRLFVIEPNPKMRQQRLNLPVILGTTVQQEFPKFLKQRFKFEIGKKLERLSR
tara:strand:+ start:5243 stop:5968 length:726 start_codon:yes stop_codon:yes gene_type:complete